MRLFSSSCYQIGTYTLTLSLVTLISIITDNLSQYQSDIKSYPSGYSQSPLVELSSGGVSVHVRPEACT